MINITLQNFKTDLLQASLDQAILLNIWAPWSEPAKLLSPVLEKLEVAYAGRFTLATLNSESETEIALQLSKLFGVRTIPFCVMFKGGQPIDGFVDLLPEAEIRQFLDKHVPSVEEMASAEDLEDAEALLAGGNTDSAIAKLLEAVAINPANDNARADCLRALLMAGRVDEARAVFNPVAGQVLPDPRLTACGHWLAACEQAPLLRSPDVLTAAIAANRRDFEARFELAQLHFAAQRFIEAMDELLEIIMRDKAWNSELARKTYVAVLDVMAKPAPAKPAAAAPKGALEIAGKVDTTPVDPEVDRYRRKLSMALF
jgi:putative thioredoxin